MLIGFPKKKIKFGVIQCINEGTIHNRAIFTILGSLWQNVWVVGSKKVMGCKNRMSILYSRAKFDGISGRTAAWDKNKCVFVSCMFVTLHKDSFELIWPAERSGLSSFNEYSVSICRPILMLFSALFKERNAPSILYADLNCIVRWRHRFSMKSAKILKKNSKPDGNVCAHDFDHLGAAYN